LAVIAATLAVAAASGDAASAAGRFEVVGACRDGVPNGAYELRMSDGRLRAAGAFALGKKTGTFIFWAASGGRIAVVPYDEDLKTGTVARWYTNASGGESGRRLEAPFSENLLHGIERSWHPNGVERSERRYEHGTLVSASAWDKRGTPLPQAQAMRLAAQDQAADERFLAELDASVQAHRPRCE
jgi:antitoxin component YwqK of YwqJK toxin-antitoxin module